MGCGDYFIQPDRTGFPLIMRCGDYFIKSDRTGFPLIGRENWNFYISLFPVSKYQFERFMADSGPRKISNNSLIYTDNWYHNILKLNPRSSWKQYEDKQWQLFITGITREEISPFLKYLGKDFRLPEEKEWIALFEHSAKIREVIETSKRLFTQLSPPASLWIEKGLYPLVEEGLLEFLSDGNCIGKPFYGLLPNTYNPRDVRQVNWELSKKVVGFRVVKEGK